MAKTANSPKSFESAIAELESIVQEMETGNITLEQALEHYQRGAGLLKYCQETLQAAEQRVLQLENGVLAPLDNPEDRRSPE
ncbi:exodeoxyribonuclease VII small subunit [Aromatoleum petrolei]|uniref:Exodeoxyribonuclease 7 small subunit n=1 Tax=Aromatoleum petrolei TaxID=76116 RepID=A0ABX1MIP3_9RHOO|nr:exodeoxyribonuclease VII small subunit [Aromatoleum petrolei]NMF87815.1 exodeoxyribonuclease VII small subunit [Aromatoleum petrolei]QTQ35319.1 Exodeoxyribonuclease 7, small subunit [Aromatoleum petrolei]